MCLSAWWRGGQAPWGGLAPRGGQALWEGLALWDPQLSMEPHPATDLGTGLACAHHAPDCREIFYCPVSLPISVSYLAEGKASIQSHFTAEALFLF